MGARLAAGDHVADRYEVLSEIGRGAMGQVFLARDTKFGQQVALKVALARVGANEELFRTRFEREARIGHQLGKTPGFVRALDWGETQDGRLYLAMDHVASAGPLDLEGGTRQARLQRVLLAARLVAECHRQGIVHRDIKPTNFLATTDGELYLTDFGLAKTRDEADLPDALAEGAATQTGVAVGTPAYMPPEQFSDAKSVDERGDVFALGVMLFRALTGKPPYKGRLSSLLLEHEKVRQGKLLPPRPRAHAPDVPKALDDLAARAVAVEADARPSAQEIAETLERELAPYAPTLVDRPARRGSSGRQAAVAERRVSSRRARVDEAVRSYAVPPSRLDRWVKRLGRAGLLAALVGIPLLLSGALLLDLGGVQSLVVPDTYRKEIGNLTARIYAQLPPQQVARLDATPPRLVLQRADPARLDWTIAPVVSLKLIASDASLRSVTVASQSPPITAEVWRQSLAFNVPVPVLGENTIEAVALDAAGLETTIRIVVWRVDPARLLVNTTAKRLDDDDDADVLVRGRLEPAISIPIRVGETEVTTDAKGTFTIRLSGVDTDRVRLKATSPLGDEVLEWIQVSSGD